MCKKLTFLTCFALVLGSVGVSTATENDPNLLGWWKLDDGEGTIASDSSGRENHGIIYNPDAGMGPDGSVWDTDPERGVVLSFNGNDTDGAYVDAGRIPAMTLEIDFTWAFWAKQHPDQAGDRYDVILGNRFGGTEEPLQFIKFTPSEFEYYHRGGGPGGTNDVGTMDIEDLPTDVWIHQVVVKDGTLLTYYRDGLAADSIIVENTIDENPFYMGGDALVSTDYHERWHGWLSDVRIYNRALDHREVLAAMAGVEVNPYIAYWPEPVNEAIEVPRDVTLNWRPGDFADKRNIYLGTSFDDVNQASLDNPLDLLVSQGHDANSYSPDGLLEFGQTYYWRIDEANNIEPNSPWKGDIWSFTVANYIILEDFEDYNDWEPDTIYLAWVDGYGDPANGSTSGYPNPIFSADEHFVETNVVRSGLQAYPYFYDNTAASKSEATKTLTSLTDWTQDGVVTLRLWYIAGQENNAPEPMYIVINNTATVVNDDANAALATEWTEWILDLQDFANQGLNLASVNSITIGFGDGPPGGAGMVIFDDIRLYNPEPETEPVAGI